MKRSSGSWAESPLSTHISTSVTFRVPLGRPFWYLHYALYPLAKARGLTAHLDKSLLMLTVLFIVQTLALSGCSKAARISWLRDRSQDYKTAKHCPSLVIPKGMPVETFSDTYDIPSD